MKLKLARLAFIAVTCLLAIGMAVEGVVAYAAANLHAVKSGSITHQNRLRVPNPQLDPKYGMLIQTEDDIDLTGDGYPDLVMLFGTKRDTSSPYYDKLNVVVQREGTQEVLSIPLPYGGYSPIMKFCDLNGDGVADILVTADTGGSGGYSEQSIVTLRDGKPALMPVPKLVQASGEFVDGFKVRIKVEETERTYTLDRGRMRKEYEEAGIYNKQGKVIKREQPTIGAFGVMEPVHPGVGGGPCSLVGLQRISGIYNADTIGYLISLWKWNPSMDKWTLTFSTVDSAM